MSNPITDFTGSVVNLWVNMSQPVQAVTVLLGSAFVINLVRVLLSRTRHSSRHKYRINQSKTVLKKIHQLDTWQQQIAYLRKINAYTFEEVILTALDAQGVKVKRNKRYSNDGGIDGRAYLDGIPMLIQAKRYQNFVSTEHIRDFVELCQKQHCVGLFIHTGRTPKAAFEAIHGSTVQIISGPKLSELLTVPHMVQTGVRHDVQQQVVKGN
ncbi:MULTISPECIES: restriction endonuclease [Aeromonas]|uniref:restriction endonuclease n=1 Tax=Aeromonas TaxID=642 RepID=UPI002B052693|nr:restriction endonuclease [Aeromonas jandaei]